MSQKLYDQYKDGSSSFDKEHNIFRRYSFQKYMYQREKEFINNYSFEGDENFTRRKQRTFLKLCFRYGHAGIINKAKMISDKLDKNFVDFVKNMGVSLSKIVSKTGKNHIPVAVFGSMWDSNDMVVKGSAITSALNMIGQKSYDVDSSNTAILTYDDNNLSGYWWWLLPAYMHSTGETVLKKRLSLIDGKLVSNKANNTNRNIQYDNIYDVDESSVDLSPSQTSITGNDKKESIDVATLLGQKLKKLDLSNGESVNDILNFIKDNEQYVFFHMGKRINQNDGKQERSISMDFESIEVHWRLQEKEFLDMMEIFIENYKEVFGKQLTLKVLSDETLKNLEEREMRKSGREGVSNESTTENI